MDEHELRNETPFAAFTRRPKQEKRAMDGKSIVIGALLVGLAVVGYLYWDSQHNTVFKAPGVEIRKN